MAVVSVFVISIVGKIGLGLEVSGFGAAYIAAIIIAVVAGVIRWLLGNRWASPSVAGSGRHRNLIIAAVVLLISGGSSPA